MHERKARRTPIGRLDGNTGRTEYASRTPMAVCSPWSHTSSAPRHSAAVVSVSRLTTPVALTDPRLEAAAFEHLDAPRLSHCNPAVCSVPAASGG